jgi:hypothetical protein
MKRKHGDSIMNVIKVFYYLLISSHLGACIWLILNRIEDQENSWFVRANLKDASNFEIYVEALVFICTTMMGAGLGN